MTQQTRSQDLEPILQAVDESWRAFVFASDPREEGSSKAVVSSLDAWTADQLLTEVLERCAEDAPALRLMQATVLQALLNALDSQSPAVPERG